MKKFAFLFVSLWVMNLMVWAGNDKPIQVSDLPRAAQQFIQKYFVGQSVAMAKVESEFLDKNYDVIFTNGDMVEFDKKGNWTKVDCKHQNVPQAIIPVAIQQYVSKNYPDAKVREIEVTDCKGYEIKLTNGFEVEFDKRMKVVDLER